MYELSALLEKKGAVLLRHANKIKIPVYGISTTEAGAAEFNCYYKELLNRGYNSIVRTPKGGVSISKANFKPPMWDVQYISSCLELTILAEGRMLRIQFRQNTSLETGEKKKIYGRRAFEAFSKELKKDGINIDDYVIDNGLEVKKTIPKYMIREADRTVCGFDKVYENCHHIDFHNSFPAGLCNTHPEFRPTVERLYKGRKKKPINKAILNHSMGYFQSIPECQARWAHLAKDAITDNNDRVYDLSQKLVDSGRRVLLWNVDGVWYQGDIYHGEGEGSNLGDWENDHVNCTFRAKSRGAYEFIEDGKYYPVLRGYTKLDKVKARQDWVWGDIFQLEAEEQKFYWINGVGIVDADDQLY